MRFVIQELTVATVCDKQIDDHQNIIKIIENIKKNGLVISLVICKKKDKYNSDISSYPEAKIIDFDIDSKLLAIKVLMKSAQLKLKNIYIDEIEEMKILNSKNNISIPHDNIGRFELIDLS
jgi:hypothetical protein